MSRMGSSTLWGKIIVLVAVCGWCLSAQAKYNGGSGTEAEPFRISSVPNWQELMATTADWASHFVLTTDIDLNDVPITPVGNSTNQFTGVFDGNDYVIRNADVNMPGSDSVGLFGHLGTGGQIRNLGVEDVSIVGRRYVGGLAGDSPGTISNCYSTGSVTGSSGVGGLVGIIGSGSISNCYSTGSVSGSSSVGGLVGIDHGTIANCYSTGSVVGGGIAVGGLVGQNGGTISDCYSTGPVAGPNRTGGLVGENDGTTSNCYSTGSVTGDFDVGGLVGYKDRGIITSSFWDVNTSGRLGSSGGKGVTTEQMKSVIIYRNAGWTGEGWVIDDGVDYPHLAWEGTSGVPIAEAEPVPLLGEGTEQSPYEIWTTEDFAILSWHTLILDKHIELKGDVDLAGVAFYPIGDLGGFTGVFDGGGYVIHNADVNMPGSDFVGLFGCLGMDGQIKDLGVEDISVLGREHVGGLVGYSHGAIRNCYSSGTAAGTGDYLGGLVGWSDGTIANCYSTGSVSGRYGVGGLLGWNYYGTVTNCYSSGIVSASIGYVGGLVGSNYSGTIGNSYSSASASANEVVGGLVGWNSRGSTTSNCYSTGLVTGGRSVGGLVGDKDPIFSVVSWSFWDVNTSGWATSDGGTPKTTGEMKTQSTFTSAGWDFIEVWDIGESQTCPFLRTYLAGDINHDGVVDFRDITHLAADWLGGVE